MHRGRMPSDEFASICEVNSSLTTPSPPAAPLRRVRARVLALAEAALDVLLGRLALELLALAEAPDVLLLLGARRHLLALGEVADVLLLRRAGLLLLSLGEALVGLLRLGGVLTVVDAVGERRAVVLVSHGLVIPFRDRDRQLLRGRHGADNGGNPPVKPGYIRPWWRRGVHTSAACASPRRSASARPRAPRSSGVAPSRPLRSTCRGRAARRPAWRARASCRGCSPRSWPGT